MSEIIVLVAGIGCFIIGLIVGKFVLSSKNSNGNYDKEILKLQNENVRLTEVENQLKERLQDAQNLYDEEMHLRRKEQEGEGKVLEKIAPVSAIVKQMQEKIDALEKERSEQYGKISTLMNDAKLGQEDLKKITAGLSGALRSNQSRGQWGEIQLKTIVEATGMMEHVDFDTQSTLAGENSINRPDMVIHLPGERHLIIDSKVPAGSYLDACEIDEFASEENRAKKENLLKDHASAVKKQVDLLSKKEYQTGNNLNTVDFVIMFIPSEAMLSSALEQDAALLEYAFSKKIALASSVSLFSVLKTVSFAWQQQALNENANAIGELGKELLKRVGILANHSNDLAKSLEKSVENYNKFASSLERNVLSTANDIAKKLDLTQNEIESPKTIELSAKNFTKPELTGKED